MEAKAGAGEDGTARVPRVLAFDLDGTLWSPEMYELWGGGSPFEVEGEFLKDRSGTLVRLLGVTREALYACKTDDAFAQSWVAYVSRTDEPSWARECMRLFEVGPGINMDDAKDIEIISKSNKRRMFEKIAADTGVDYADMVFYDNEPGNMHDVSPLGVRCVYTPDGLTQECWEASLAAFAKIGPEEDNDTWEAALSEFGVTSGVGGRAYRW
eukprot:CAMPEP_0118877954 /NCGR_PEP_ID=MMETSP1163-20130328/18059_1 /TAXON_ID=124430 /ORGANISM="Phaeomonas parva, Strain CCMP2877" /LENGTH=211 /DNA_ID=CAMNT_0006813727 /DNA_START=69 /DNA_END=704 /DNA_ORIENTATION=-